VNAIARHASHFPAGTRGVLVVANPSQDPRATARLVAAMHARDPVRIHVAAVQCPPTGYAGSYLRAIDVNKVLHDLGRQRMASLCAELDALGIAHRTHVEIGRGQRESHASRAISVAGACCSAPIRVARWAMRRCASICGCCAARFAAMVASAR
jgi:hypothetical protein